MFMLVVLFQTARGNSMTIKDVNDNHSKQLNPQDPQFYLDRRIPLHKAEVLASERRQKNQLNRIIKTTTKL